jgi:hypothetical protein
MGDDEWWGIKNWIMPEAGYYLSLPWEQAGLCQSAALLLSVTRPEHPVKAAEVTCFREVLEWLDLEQITLEEFRQLFAEWARARALGSALCQGAPGWLLEHLPLLKKETLATAVPAMAHALTHALPSLPLIRSIFQGYDAHDKWFLKPSESFQFYRDYLSAKGVNPSSYIDFRKGSDLFFHSLGVQDYCLAFPIFASLLANKDIKFLQRIKIIATKRSISTDFYFKLLD